MGLCFVCMGKGKILSKKCSECGGKGGKIISCSQRAKELFDQKQELFSDRERLLFEKYAQKFSHEDIARDLDISLSEVVNIVYSIEQKLNRK